MFKQILLVCLLCMSLPAAAWDSTGHRLIAAIAYKHLTKQTQTKVDELSKIGDKPYPPFQRFLFAAIWPDIYARSHQNTKSWHYIGYPWSVDGTPTTPPKNENVVWAIAQSESILKSKYVDTKKQALALRFLEHFVGDIHQPLHGINRFSRKNPKGDGGGNSFPIQNRYADHLHAIWDQGVGLFRSQAYRYPLRTRDITRLAKKIEQQYPESYFGAKSKNSNPASWAQESFELAKVFAYATQENAPLSSDYVIKSQEIVAQRIALAGYRLATVLNNIFDYEKP